MEQIQLWVKEEKSERFVLKSVPFWEAIDIIFNQIVATFPDKHKNVLHEPVYRLTGYSMALTAMERHANANSDRLRDFMRQKVQQRKRSTQKLTKSCDLLSIFLEEPDVFTEDVILDELADFMTAGTMTTSLLTQTIIGHFATCKESLDKVRDEFDQYVSSQHKQDVKVESFASDRAAFLKRVCSHDCISDLEYLHCVVNEALRTQPPVPQTSQTRLSQDTKIGKILIKSDCNIYVNMFGLHMNGKQWQRPKEFLPQRFDPNDPLFLTPDGKKRHPMSLSPFNGGRRICFGKTFAESSTRLASTYFSQYFDFEFV